LVYSTYLGGSGNDYGESIAVDTSGSAYVTGSTGSSDFPTTPGAFQTYGVGDNAFVTEINSTGSALVYSTYLGGSQSTEGTAIAVDSSGNAYVTGNTASTDFPVTPGAFQTTCNGGSNCRTNGDAFVTKFDPSGSALVYSTYLGGSGGDFGQAIAVDNSGDAYVTGYTGSTDFPTRDPVQPTYGGNAEDTFVTEINPAGSALVYSTYLGGSGREAGTGIAVDSSDNAYVTGWTTSTDFPTVNPVQPALSGQQNVFIAKIPTTSTTTTLLSSINPSVRGKPATFTAVVSSLAGTPTGKIKYLNGTTLLATVKLTSGSAKYTTSKLPPGSNSITAVYQGDSNHSGSTSAPVNQIVQAVTATTLTSSPNPSIYGQAVTFTAVVSSSAGAPPDGETVTFMEGATVLGTGHLSGGSASFTTSTLVAGNNAITAVYGGDSDFGGSASKAVKQVVQTPGPYGVVSPTALNFGQVVVGKTSAAKLTSLENTGESQLTVSNVSISGNFAITVNSCEHGVKPLTHCNVYVTFTPGGVGTETGSLTFTDNASNSPQTISLTGTGIN
jgi:hypothetical protein